MVIKAQELLARNLSAAALALRARLPSLERAERRRARALLERAFACSERAEAPLELVRALESLAWPLDPCIPRPLRLPELSLPRTVDRAWVDGLIARWDFGEGIQARVDRFLAVTGDQRPPMPKADASPRPPDYDLELTEG